MSCRGSQQGGGSREAASQRKADPARQTGISRQTACKWLRRSWGGEGLADCSGRPRRLARLTPPDVEERVVEPRASMLLAPLALASWPGAACPASPTSTA